MYPPDLPSPEGAERQARLTAGGEPPAPAVAPSLACIPALRACDWLLLVQSPQGLRMGLVLGPSKPLIDALRVYALHKGTELSQMSFTRLADGRTLSESSLAMPLPALGFSKRGEVLEWR